ASDPLSKQEFPQSCACGKTPPDKPFSNARFVVDFDIRQKRIIYTQRSKLADDPAQSVRLRLVLLLFQIGRLTRRSRRVEEGPTQGFRPFFPLVAAGVWAQSVLRQGSRSVAGWRWASCRARRPSHHQTESCKDRRYCRQSWCAVRA